VISGGGFDSLTAKHDLAQEIAKSNRPVRLLHVGDYDPSGVHLFSALDEDVRGFLTRLNPDARVVSERAAILPEHVERFQLQPAPAKATDNRSFVGIGDDPTATVQAEARAPDDLADLVEAALRRGWDEDAADRLADLRKTSVRVCNAGWPGAVAERREAKRGGTGFRRQEALRPP
jgi:hypothetical protein